MDRTEEAHGEGPKNRVVFQLTVADLESAAGRDLPDEAIERFADCFGYSSVNESIENVLDSILIDYPENDED